MKLVAGYFYIIPQEWFEGGSFLLLVLFSFSERGGSRQSAITLSGSADVKTLAWKNILQDIHRIGYCHQRICFPKLPTEERQLYGTVVAATILPDLILVFTNV